MTSNTSLDLRIQAELILRGRARAGAQLAAPENWREWCTTLFPKYFSKPFAQRHIELWEWAEAITAGNKPPVFIGIWGRGGAKSTNAEALVIRLGAKGVRKYGWYVSSTQDKADQHVENIGSMLESQEFASYYSKMSRRAVNKYGNSKGWRRSRLRTASGFTVDAFGLDSGVRGAKVEEQRPDFIILDDVDELHESIPVTLKKMQVITDTVLPAGSSDCAILAIQNLIHSEGIFARLVDGRADFLRNRILSGPHVAIKDLTYVQRDGRFVITGGTATWEGQTLEIAQTQIDDWGISAFLREAQHEVERTGGLWDHIEFQHDNYDLIAPYLIKTVVWVDPAVTSTDSSDCQGISIGGLLPNNKLTLLYAWEGVDSPEKALERAILKGMEYGAESVGVETDNGGDAWRSVYKQAADHVIQMLRTQWLQANPDKKLADMPEIRIPKFKSDKAGHGHGSKVERNGRMMTDYERGKVTHCIGTHSALEKALRRFANPPLDLADSWYYCWFELIGRKKFSLHVSSANN